MSIPNIVIDTNVVIAALHSKKGASFKLLSLVGSKKFKTHDSVPLVLQYEDVVQRDRVELGLSEDDVSDLIDSLCARAKHHEIYFLWRPSLPDANDELILELAVAARCEYIVTHNIADFSRLLKKSIIHQRCHFAKVEVNYFLVFWIPAFASKTLKRVFQQPVRGAEKFGVKAVTPDAFLKIIGEV